MDSLALSKKYEVLSISRLDSRSFGLTTEQINHLADEDMAAIADKIGELVAFVSIVLWLMKHRVCSQYNWEIHSVQSFAKCF